MNFWENFSTAIYSLVSNKSRALLTMLGIIIGISSVIIMSALGNGGQEKITGDLKKTGYGNFQIAVDSDSDDYRDKYALDESDIEALKASGEFEAVSGTYSDRLTIRYGEETRRIEITGTNLDYEKISSVDYVKGRDFIPAEYEDRGNYIVIDDMTAKVLFGDESPIGKTAEISDFGNDITNNFYIIGIYENPLSTMASIFGGGKFFPSFGRVPLKTLEKLYSIDEYDSIKIKSKDPEKLDLSMAAAQRIMEEKNISGIYELNTTTNNTSSFDSILSTLTLFITAVASISLLVGGIGVMNIMLVSVTERIKEIGIRKALGATNNEILAQFMVEAIILTLVGGLLGIVIGVGGSIIAGDIVNITPIFTKEIMVISVSISTLIGLVFGVFPARKASLLNPIEALHNE